jgi:hypothetical protein
MPVTSQHSAVVSPTIVAKSALVVKPAAATQRVAAHAVSQQAVVVVPSVPTPLLILPVPQATSPVPPVLPVHLPVMSASQQSPVVAPTIVAKSVLVEKPVPQTDAAHAVSQQAPASVPSTAAPLLIVPATQATSPVPPVLPVHLPALR